MATLRHPNIVQFIGATIFPPAIVTGAWTGVAAASVCVCLSAPLVLSL